MKPNTAPARSLAVTLTLIGSLAGGANGDVVFHSTRASIEAATTGLDLLSDEFEHLQVGTHFDPDPAQLLGGKVSISGEDTLSFSPDGFNEIVALPTYFGSYGIDSTSISGNYLAGRIQNLMTDGEQDLTFTLDFDDTQSRAIGFDFSGAVGGDSTGAELGLEVTTLSGLVATYRIPSDDGFVGAVTAANDAIASFRLYDWNTMTTGNAEVFAIDNLLIAVLEAPVISDPELPFTTFRIEDLDPLNHLGNSVAALGDVNGDGVPDFAVSGSIGMFGFDFGIARVFSGRDGSALYTLQSELPGPGFAEDRNLTGLGDLDGDGVGEIAVGSPWGTTLDPAGFFEIYRGNDGSFLRAHIGSGEDSLGEEIAALGDVDGDGVSDYAASNLELGNEGGRVRVYSGAGGEELGQLVSQEMLRFWSIAGPGDLDGDGRGELAVTLWSEFDPWKPGEIRVLSGILFGDALNPAGAIDVQSETARQATLFTLEGRTDVPGGFESIGLGLNGLGDIDGDGIPDLGAGTGPTSDAVVFSGADGSRIHEWSSDRVKLSQIVVETEGIGDLDGDGFRDVVVARAGSVSVMSGRDGSLLAEKFGDGDLGEEVAAIGDLDGDGISEVLASAPAGGYALLISFSLGRGPVPGTSTGFTVSRQGDRIVVTWKAGLEGASLEQSTDLVDWQPVDDVLFENLFVVPTAQREQLYYRLRFVP